MQKQKNLNAGFSLVEIAVAIIILGILALIISGGNSLIKQANIRKTVGEFTTLAGSFDNFESIYEAIPGDMANAYQYFSTNCTTAANLCNGDGDTHIEGVEAESSAAPANNDLEYLRYFQHLKLASIIEGDYSDVGAGVESTDHGTLCNEADIISESCVRAPGYNVLGSAISDTGYYLVYYDDTIDRHVIILGNSNSSSYTGENSGEILSAIDAKSIDLKLDDGIAHTGKVIALGTGGSANCREADSDYNETASGINCYLTYLAR